MINVSIVIPHHNGKKLLLDCVDSIYRNITTKDFEIIVVDNMSNDFSADDVKAKFPSIHLLKAESNLGYSGGCNFGAKQAKGKYIIFLNNDTLHTKNWVEELVSFLEKNPQVGAAQP